MASTVPPKKGIAYTFYVSLTSQADVKLFQAAPTLAAGDVVVIKDGVLDGNIDTLPTAVTSATRVIAVALSAAEMTADTVTVIFSDAAGAQWCDLVVDIHTAARLSDDLAYPTTSGRSIDVDSAGGVEVGSIQAGAITAAAIATDAIDADALATDAVSEIVTAVWAATTRTLSSLSALLASISADIWAYVTRTLTSTAASTVSAVSGSTLTLTQYADYAATLTGLTIPSTWSKIYLTVKADEADVDTAALVKIQKSVATTGDGLSYIEGAAYATPAHGSLTIDQAAGTIAIAITADATEGLAKRQDASYDVKCITTAGAVSILTSGVAAIVSTETRSIA